MKSDGKWVLQSVWQENNSQTGQMCLSLCGEVGMVLPVGFRLAYTAITRIPPGTQVTGARFVSRTANYHELAPLEGMEPLCADDQGLMWEIVIPVLSHRPQHCTDGPKSAFLILPDGSTQPVQCDPLQSKEAVGLATTAATDDCASAHMPQEMPTLGLLPAPNHSQIANWTDGAPPCFCVEQPNDTVDVINALYARLYADEPVPYQQSGGGRKVILSPAGRALASHGKAAYGLHFANEIITVQGTQEGLFYALLALAQIWRAAKRDPSKFSFPQTGVIEDWPQHDWRGMHLDVSRQVYSKQAIKDFLDVLAWHRLNRFHWHLTDDEGWRLESPSYPDLTRVGAWRGYKHPILPQHGSGAEAYGGFYSQQDTREILAHAASLHIEVVPEVDVPGHCQSVLVSVPELLDPSAIQGGASVQGYVNNALNPGLSATWTFLDTIFGEICDLFPGRFVHMGGDEVADSAWSGSRAANSWAQAKGYVDEQGKAATLPMQAAILRFVEGRLSNAGKTPLAWEEAAKGGGLNPDKTIMMAWMKAQSGSELAAQGYRVIMCPGEAYYLDMAQSSEWAEPGLSWAGTSSPHQTYHFDPMATLETSAQMLGVQGCIWSENLTSRNLFNHMVFPRLSAIAESAWCNSVQKNWQSFTNRADLMPKMPKDKS